MNHEKRKYSRWDDTNDHTVVIKPQCLSCAHWHGPADTDTCDAFPKHIPSAIYLNEVIHDTDYPGDDGIHYAPKA